MTLNVATSGARRRSAFTGSPPLGTRLHRVRRDALRAAFRCQVGARKLASRLLTFEVGSPSGGEEVMKRRFKVGVTLSSLIGIALFGSSSRHTVSVAQADQEDRFEAPLTVAPASAKAVDVHANLGVKPTVTGEAAEASNCAPGMVEVEGDYCPNVEQKCLRWLDPETKQRCAEFLPTSACKGKSIHKHFCVDRFEYPNVQGEKPVVMKSWLDAKATCQSEGKRLCGESEWTLACEGKERLPYPYGYTRSDEACNIDKPHPDVNEAAIANPATRDAEVARLDQRDPSGAREACVSPYGVYDMTGNVDEWVVNESGKPFKSGLKGGYWGPVRDRCRPMTIAHNEEFEFYQIGFRCCGEPTPGSDKPPAPKPDRAPGVAPVGAQGTTLPAI
jgi:sulfatase modifying factor 1